VATCIILVEEILNLKVTPPLTGMIKKLGCYVKIDNLQMGYLGRRPS
jgi:hypothetical protein